VCGRLGGTEGTVRAGIIFISMEKKIVNWEQNILYEKE
jgi:hypothetical protein